MPGQPLKRRVIAELHRMARAELGDDMPEGQDEACVEYLAHRVESGDTLLRVAKELGETLGIEVRRAVLSKYLTQAAERLGRIEEGGLLAGARARGADALAEAAVVLVDDAPETREGLAKAIAQAKQRSWLAEKLNPEQYGQKAGPLVSISLGSLHLDALRKRPTLERVAIAGAIASGDEVVSDYEVMT